MGRTAQLPGSGRAGFLAVVHALSETRHRLPRLTSTSHPSTRRVAHRPQAHPPQADSPACSPGTSFPAFLAAHPALLDKRLLARHYSAALLSAAAARTGWVDPDLTPFPWHDSPGGGQGCAPGAAITAASAHFPPRPGRVADTPVHLTTAALQIA